MCSFTLATTLTLTLQGHKVRSYYTERLAIDYKWFDTHGIKPRFEFGFGLSYTTFELSDLSVEKRVEPVTDTVQPTNERSEGPHDLYDTLYVARVAVKNTGDRKGKEVVQLVSLMNVHKRMKSRNVRRNRRMLTTTHST